MSLFNQVYQYDEKVISNWLYGSYDETKYQIFSALYAIPGVNNYFDYLLDKRSDSEYLYRYGMDYSDIHDPRKLRQTSSYGRTLNFVSRNVESLYHSASKPVSKK